MTFIINKTTLIALEKELSDSHQAVMTVAPTNPAGLESGTITHDGIVASYSWVPNCLTVEVKEGGNWIVNHLIHEKVQAAIDALTAKAA